MLPYLLPLLAYLTGSISSAILVCRSMGLPDPRASGSRNPGATNVLRIGGKKAAALTLAGDMLKGLLPVWLASLLTPDPTTLSLCAFAAFLGHLYPVYFGFGGGKGVATALGATFGLSWVTGLLVATTWLAVSLSLRISSAAALTAFALAPLYIWVIRGNPVYAATLAVMALMLFWRHRENIKRLLKGEEPRIGASKKSPDQPES